MRLLAVHPGPLMYTKIFLRLEPLGLEVGGNAPSWRFCAHSASLLTDIEVVGRVRHGGCDG
jgi:hypothetical protein